MLTARLNIITMQEQEVSVCPYCGATPMIEVTIKKHPMESDNISHEEVTCPCCGLGSSREVWEALCKEIDHPILNK